MVFESMGCPGLYIASNAVLSSFSMGRPSSLIVDLGASRTSISAVCDGYELRKSKLSTLRGGDWMDGQLRHQIAKSGVTLTSFMPLQDTISSSLRELHLMDVVKDVKKWMCFVPSLASISNNRSEFMSGIQIPPYVLPDGTKISYFDEISSVPEALFSPTKSMLDCPLIASKDINYKLSLAQLVHQSLTHVDIDIRKDLCGNILLVGGGALIDGMQGRLAEELSPLIPPTYKVK